MFNKTLQIFRVSKIITRTLWPCAVEHQIFQSKISALNSKTREYSFNKYL